MWQASSDMFFIDVFELSAKSGNIFGKKYGTPALM